MTVSASARLFVGCGVGRGQRDCLESPLHRLRGRVREGAAPPATFVGSGAIHPPLRHLLRSSPPSVGRLRGGRPRRHSDTCPLRKRPSPATLPLMTQPPAPNPSFPRRREPRFHLSLASRGFSLSLHRLRGRPRGDRLAQQQISECSTFQTPEAGHGHENTLEIPRPAVQNGELFSPGAQQNDQLLTPGKCELDNFFTPGKNEVDNFFQANGQLLGSPPPPVCGGRRRWGRLRRRREGGAPTQAGRPAERRACPAYTRVSFVIEG